MKINRYLENQFLSFVRLHTKGLETKNRKENVWTADSSWQETGITRMESLHRQLSETHTKTQSTFRSDSRILHTAKNTHLNWENNIKHPTPRVKASYLKGSLMRCIPCESYVFTRYPRRIPSNATITTNMNEKPPPCLLTSFLKSSCKW